MNIDMNMHFAIFKRSIDHAKFYYLIVIHKISNVTKVNNYYMFNGKVAKMIRLILNTLVDRDERERPILQRYVNHHITL